MPRYVILEKGNGAMKTSLSCLVQKQEKGMEKVK